MFFLTEALLLTKNITASTHKGIIGLFGQHFIKTGVFDKELGKALNEAYDKRLEGDYGVGLDFSKIVVKEQLIITEKFVQTILTYFKKHNLLK